MEVSKREDPLVFAEIAFPREFAIAKCLVQSNPLITDNLCMMCSCVVREEEGGGKDFNWRDCGSTLGLDFNIVLK